jgi:hypothetical protein
VEIQIPKVAPATARKLAGKVLNVSRMVPVAVDVAGKALTVFGALSLGFEQSFAQIHSTLMCLGLVRHQLPTLN